MLEVKVSIIPFGDETARRELDKFYIVNDGKHEDIMFGNYILYDKDKHHIGEIGEHKRSKGFWPLVKRAIKRLTND